MVAAATADVMSVSVSGECSAETDPSAWVKANANAWTPFASKYTAVLAFVVLINRVRLALGVSAVVAAEQAEGHPNPSSSAMWA